MKIRHLLSLFLVLALNFSAFSQIPSGYYNGTDGLTGDALREKLRSIISAGHTSNSYDNLEYDFYDTDNFGSNKVWDMYSMDENGNANYYFYYNSNDECGSYDGEGDCYNKEHSFPKSWWGGGSAIQYADLFHLVPTDGYVNNRRGNLPFGEVSSPTWTSTNGSKVGTCSYPGYSSTVFEPIDVYKGDFARNYFYMATRYKNSFSSWDSPMLSGDNYANWAIDMLREWHISDPVSQKEIDRNNAVYQIQHNRNPYIDHPEWVCVVWGGDCGSLFFTSTPSTNAIIGSQYTYNITYEGENATLTCSGNPDWLSFTNISDGEAKLQGTPGTSDAGSYSISLVLSDGEETVNQDFTIIVPDMNAVQTIFNKDFNDQTMTSGGWSTYSVTGDNAWIIDSYNDMFYAYMSGYSYGENYANEDWIISPAVDLDNYIEEVLTFETAAKFDGEDLRLYYSTNYSGSGSPTSATWTEITGFALSQGDDWVWTSSGDIDVSEISGENVYFGFKYISTTSDSRAWELDDILLEGKLDIPNIISENFENQIRIFPNPASEEVNIDYYLVEGSEVIIDIYDLTGKKVSSIENSIQNSGNHNINWKINNITSGIYLINIKIENRNIFKKVVINN